VPVGEDFGGQPDDRFRQGFRILVQIEGVTRAFTSTAAATWSAIDQLHDAWLAQSPQHVGKLPVVELESVRPQNAGSSTILRPVFVIVGWAERPADMPAVRRAPPVPDLDDSIPF
jgi:hypothetical protein